MKQVKQLCYDHLKTLSMEEIRDSILPSTATTSPSAMMTQGSPGLHCGLLEHGESPGHGGGKGGEDPRREGGGGDGDNKMEGMVGGDCDSRSEGVSDEEIVITISDVSEDEGSTAGGSGQKGCPPEPARGASRGEKTSENASSKPARSSTGNQEKPVKPVVPSRRGTTADGKASIGDVRDRRGALEGRHDHPSTSKHGDRTNTEQRNTKDRSVPSPSVSKQGVEMDTEQQCDWRTKSDHNLSKGVVNMDTEQPCDRRTESSPTVSKSVVGGGRSNLKDDVKMEPKQWRTERGRSNPTKGMSNMDTGDRTGEVRDSASSQASKVTDTSERAPESRTVGSAQLLEMELRSRALEAELRRNNASKCPEGRLPDAASPEQHGRVENWTGEERMEEVEGDEEMDVMCEDVISLHPECDGNEEEEGGLGGHGEGQGGGGESESGPLKMCEILEERLRQRALQAMLDKRKRNT